MPNGPDHEGVVGERLPVPEAEADALRARVDAMIDHLDQVIVGRQAKREVYLEEWQAPNRGPWDEDFFYAQLELQEAIDRLQEYKGRVESVIESIREHNAAVPPPESTTPTGTTTPTTTTTTSPPAGGGRFRS